MTTDEPIELIPPGHYTVKYVAENKVEIVVGPYKGRTIFVPVTTFDCKVEQREIRPGEIINARA